MSTTYTKIGKCFLIQLVVVILSLTKTWALLPPEYTENDNYVVNGNVKRVVVKTFKAIDKFNEVELGEMIEKPVIVEFLENGELERLIELEKDGSISFYFISEYDNNGKIQSQKRYSSKDMMEALGVYQYDKNKNIISESAYNAKGELVYKDNFLYDKSGFVIEISRDNGQGVRVQTKKITNDAQGKELSEVIYGRDNDLLYTVKKTYDSRGLLVGVENLSKNGVLASKATYAYNQRENVEKTRHTAPNRAIDAMKIDYEYDSQGNWIKRTLYVSDYIPKMVIMRKIEYR